MIQTKAAPMCMESSILPHAHLVFTHYHTGSYRVAYRETYEIHINIRNRTAQRNGAKERHSTYQWLTHSPDVTKWERGNNDSFTSYIKVKEDSSFTHQGFIALCQNTPASRNSYRYKHLNHSRKYSSMKIKYCVVASRKLFWFRSTPQTWSHNRGKETH